MKKLFTIALTTTFLATGGVAFAADDRPVFYDVGDKTLIYKSGGKEYVINSKGDKGDKGDAGKDGLSFNRQAYLNDMSVAVGLGGLELRQGKEGVTSWSAGIGSFWSADGGDSQAIAFGIHHGITDNLGVYAKVSRSLGSNASTAAFVGV